MSEDTQGERIAVIASMAIVRDGKVLLIKEAGVPYTGEWCLPQGHVKDDETVVQAAEREAMEETGLDVHAKGLLGVYDDIVQDGRGKLHYVFLCFVGDAGSDAESIPSEEAVEHAWVSFSHGTANRIAKMALADLASRKKLLVITRR